MDAKPYDLIVVGASAAGVAASVYAARRKLNFLVLATDIGGEVATSGEIENYPGFLKTDGITLSEKFKEQLAYNHVDVRTPYTVQALEKNGPDFHVTAEGLKGSETFEAKTIIVATGMHPKHLGVPGEKEFRGRGVTYCTTCDGPLFRGKPVVTIGGGNSALESALMLAELCPSVTVINKNPAFKGEQILIDKLAAHPKITVIAEAKTLAIKGETRVATVVYQDSKGVKHEVPTEGVFIHIGNIPNSQFVKAEKDPRGAIIMNQRGETSIPGLFAAGDVATVPYWQIGIAVGTGIAASLTAIEYLNRLKS